MLALSSYVDCSVVSEKKLLDLPLPELLAITTIFDKVNIGANCESPQTYSYIAVSQKLLCTTYSSVHLSPKM